VFDRILKSTHKMFPGSWSGESMWLLNPRDQASRDWQLLFFTYNIILFCSRTGTKPYQNRSRWKAHKIHKHKIQPLYILLSFLISHSLSHSLFPYFVLFPVVVQSKIVVHLTSNIEIKHIKYIVFKYGLCLWE